MTARRNHALGLTLMVGLAAATGPASAGGPEGTLVLDASALGSGSGPARPRAVDLAPRGIGTEHFTWDGVPERGQGWLNTVVEGAYVQAVHIDGTLTRVIVCSLTDLADFTAPVAAVVYEDDGPGGSPGTLLAMSLPSEIPARSSALDCSDLTVPALERSGRTFIGVSWMPMQNPRFFIAADESNTTTAQDIYGRFRTGATFSEWALTDPVVRALGIGARVVSTIQSIAPCVDGPSILCLNEGRFRVDLDWRQPNDSRGPGMDSGLRTNDSGVLYFFRPTNLEVLIKVLNACPTSSNRYWVFYAATTNVEFTLTVTDTQTGKVKTYFNPLGTPAPPIQDTAAFATCP